MSLRDFDAPKPAVKDTSASTIMASGLLYMVEIDPVGSIRYLEQAKKLLNDCLETCLSPVAKYKMDGSFSVDEIGFEAILMNATSNGNGHHGEKEIMMDGGLVYADYYLLEAQNRLLRRELDATISKS